MVLDTGTTIGIIIALLGAIGMMGLFWSENIRLTKEVRRLQVALRDERRKDNG
jgi:ABC-type cobalamin transport system permease subunit